MSATGLRSEEALEQGVAMPRPASRGEGRVLLLRTVTLVVALALWQALSGNLVDPFWISSPLAVGAKLWLWISTGVLFRHLLVTIEETAVGFIVGGVCGVVLGGLVAQSRILQRTIDPFVTAVYGIPKVALAPLFIMWFGIGLMPKFVLAGISVFFLVFFNTLAGAREVDSSMVDALRMMGARPAQIHRIVILPASFPFIFLGFKLGLPYGFVGAVAGEMMASNEGIGFLTQNSAGQYDTAGVFAALTALMTVTVLLDAGLARLERWVFRWR